MSLADRYHVLAFFGLFRVWLVCAIPDWNWSWNWGWSWGSSFSWPVRGLLILLVGCPFCCCRQKTRSSLGTCFWSVPEIGTEISSPGRWNWIWTGISSLGIGILSWSWRGPCRAFRQECRNGSAWKATSTFLLDGFSCSGSLLLLDCDRCCG